ncbi:MAG: ACP S-malonyltransferase [Planctomycetota bacterium]|nr:ACP S-malonyltransferase [Planctomycetota bacterium]
MSANVILLCPGQGAQAVGMGQAWCEASPAAAAVFREADDVLGESLGAPLSQLCFEGPAERLNDTDVSQPAIYACSIACYRALMERNGGMTVRGAAGLSLGEYSALHIAGVFDFAEGLKLVAQRGRLMQEACDASVGGMVALIGAGEEQARQVCDRIAGAADADAAEAAGSVVGGEIEGQSAGAPHVTAAVAESAAATRRRVLVPANYNAPGQIVLSGDALACEEAIRIADEMGLPAKPLTVAGAFHSPLMQPAADRMARALADVAFQSPNIDVWANVTARPHDARDMELLKQRLVEQIVSPVKWAQSCLGLPGDGTIELHELAPGAVLRGLMRRIDKKKKVISHDEP